MFEIGFAFVWRSVAVVYDQHILIGAVDVAQAGVLAWACRLESTGKSGNSEAHTW
jgi:hypothetical protein